MADWKFVMGYPCVRHYILFYIHGPVILQFSDIDGSGLREKAYIL